jgi:hypothetical protein
MIWMHGFVCLCEVLKVFLKWFENFGKEFKFW